MTGPDSGGNNRLGSPAFCAETSMSEEPAKYQDEISRQLVEIATDMRARHAQHFARGLKVLQRILAKTLEVPIADIKRHHLVEFLRIAPDAEILRWKGISRTTLAQARSEIAGDL